MHEIEEKAREEFEAVEKKKKKGKGEVVEAKFPTPRIPDDLLYKIVEHKLNDNLCKNKGYILEGYPRVFNEAKNIFENNTDNLPNFVFKLGYYTDDFLKHRIKNSIDPSLLSDHHYTDDAITKRLQNYKNHETHESLTSFFLKNNAIDVEELDCKFQEKDLIDVCRAKIEKVNLLI
jgi:adenylate kinase